MTQTIPKRIVFLPQPEGDVVARYTELGDAIADFIQLPSGEVFFRFGDDSDQLLYVNKSMATFHEAAEVFNRCCQLHANDENTEDDTWWSSVVGQLKLDLNRIEPLGAPETSLWSATVHDTENGLLSLF